jgi:nucleoside-diphosphate-sugar epimerase
MKIAILGGDGFVGWPTSLHLSAMPGHEFHIVDNLSRRWIDTELGVQSLTPMDSIQERTRIWHAGNRPQDPFPPDRPRRITSSSSSGLSSTSRTPSSTSPSSAPRPIR